MSDRWYHDLIIDSTEAAVLTAGGAGMALEVLAGRILAPTFGSSIYVWGSIIGVFLTALSIGYYIGGKKADTASHTRLQYQLLIGAALTAVIIAGSSTIVTWANTIPIPIQYAALIPCILLFAPVTIILGTVTPTVAELSKESTKGRASGRVFAVGTVGSIIGTFGTTFYLIPFHTTTQGLGAIAGVLFLTALVIAIRRTGSVAATAFLATALLTVGLYAMQPGYQPGLFSGETVYQTQTPYQQLTITDQGNTRTLWMNGGAQGAMHLGNTDSIHVFSYTPYFHIPFLMQDDIDKVLFIGAGAYTGPKAFLEHTDAEIDVVEIDQTVVDTVKRYFHVPDTPRLTTYVDDGRRYLQQTNTTYDLIVLDAFKGTEIPFHLTTQEFLQVANNRLDQDGLMVTNLISSRTGPNADFFKASYRTYSTIFPDLYTFGLRAPGREQNIELVASKQDLGLSREDLLQRNQERDIGIDLSDELQHLVTDIDASGADLLRDEHAPVDSLAN